MDVDGVLTDGGIIFLDDTSEIKQFNSKDGFGIALGIQAGLKFGVITARTSPMVAKRVAELKIDFYAHGQVDKVAALQEMSVGFSADEIMYIGDDVLDLASKPFIGVFAAPSDSARAVLEQADLVMAERGGRGAVREAIEQVLLARGMLAKTEQLFIDGKQQNSNNKRSGAGK